MTIHTFLSYCKSHIYELHALLTAGIAFAVMFFTDSYIKSMIRRWIDERCFGVNDSKKRMLAKRAEMVILLVAVILAYAIFGVVSLISPMIHYSAITAFLSAVFTIDFYVICEQIKKGYKHE